MRNAVVLLIFFFFISEVHARLSCSAKGTVLYTVNGVWVKKDEEAAKNGSEVANLIKNFKDKLDEKEVKVKYVHNKSMSLPEDVLEGIAQELRSKYKVSNPWRYVHLALLGLSNERFILYLSVLNSAIGGSSINQVVLNYTNSLITQAHQRISDLNTADREVVASVKKLIKNELDSNKKVILIPHSQGNFVINSAIMELRQESPMYEAKYKPILGALYVANPSSNMTVEKNALIKLNTDFVVNNPIVAAGSVPANYFQKGYPGLLRPNLLEKLYSFYTVATVGNDISGHKFIETYLSSEKEAKKSGEIDHRKMVDIFKENLIDVAEQLEDNCLFPDVKAFSSLIVSSDEGKNRLNIFAGPSSSVKIDLRDGNTDYDSTSTEFSWVVSTIYNGQKKYQDITGTGKEVTIPLPYNDFEYVLTATAINIHGKESTTSFKFYVLNDRLPTYQGPSLVCEFDESLNYADGSAIAQIVLSDDSYALDGQVETAFIPYRATNFLASFGLHIAPINVTNDCPKTPLYVEIWYRCQLGTCNSPDVDGDENCNYTANTGIQFNEARVFYPSSSGYSTIDLGSGGSEDMSTAYFTDPNDSSLQIGFQKGGMCTPFEANNGSWVQME